MCIALLQNAEKRCVCSTEYVIGISSNWLVHILAVTSLRAELFSFFNTQGIKASSYLINCQFLHVLLLDYLLLFTACNFNSRLLCLMFR